MLNCSPKKCNGFVIQLNMLCAKEIFHKYIILSTIVYILKSLSVNVEDVVVVLLF